MEHWDAAQYLKFKQQRTRPAIDLAARIPLWAFPPAVLATALDTLLTARLLRRTGDPNSLRWYARLPRRRPA